MQPEQLIRVFSRNVRERRIELGLTQQELAQRMEIGQGYLSAIENGKRSPILKTIALFSEALSIAPAKLFVNRSAKRPKKSENSADLALTNS